MHQVLQGGTPLATYAYDSAGRLDTLTRANGAVTSYAYDNTDRLTDLQTTVGVTTTSRFQYSLDRMGQRTAVTETLTTQTRTIAYTYDGLQRLTGATETPGTTYDYTYDLAGNRTEVRENGALVANLSYNDANQVIGWSYDAAGNLLSDGTSTRSYDALNRLVAHDSTSYTYNGDGVLVSDGTTTYAQDLAAPLSQVLNDGTANYLYGHERLRALGGPWYVGDALGSVRQTLDDAGAVRATTSYDPWGVPTAGTPQPFGFTGELHHQGQVYLRARWYAPGQGRFVSEDPFAGWATRPYSLHPYQYAYSNPVMWTDPSGRCVPEWVPGGEPGCTLRAGIGQGRLDWQGAGDYAWDVVEGVGLPGAMAVDALAGTNGTQQILDDAGTGTYLGIAFTSVATLGKGAQVLGPRATALAGRAGAGANTLTLQAFVRGQSWLLSGSPWARLALAGGYGANYVDNATLWLLAALGDCDAVGEWTALQQLGALDGPLPFGDVLAAGVLVMPGRRGFFSVPDNLGQLRPLNSGWQESVAGLRYGPDPNYGDRVQHVLRHATDDPLRTQPHGVFEGDALAIVDEAWLSAQMGGSHVQIQVQGNRMVYHIDMGRRIGHEGGQPGAAAGYPALHRVRIVVQNNNEIITAFPER